MIEFLVPLALLIAGVFALRRLNGAKWLILFLRWCVTVFGSIVLLFLGFGVFMWNPINNETHRYVLSWESVLSNGGIVIGVVFFEWILLLLVWKNEVRPTAKANEHTNQP